MYVTFRLGSLIQLLVLIAVAAAIIGMLAAGRSPVPHGPAVVTPTSTPQSTQDVAPLGGVAPG